LHGPQRRSFAKQGDNRRALDHDAAPAQQVRLFRLGFMDALG
jgi:hypothetical protein